MMVRESSILVLEILRRREGKRVRRTRDISGSCKRSLLAPEEKVSR
jgi:hypothetical protein